jgi:lysophospholipase L1-like esterase
VKPILRSGLVRFFLWLSVLALAGELTARVLGAEPAYVREGRIRRACGCRYLRFEHAPPGMDTSVKYCINRLGLRGGLPADGALRIITLGNSTTECAYIDDAATWPHLLGCGLTAQGRDVWVGNAGVNGGSTRGNAVFLEDYLLGLHPDLLIFMPGAADRGRISAKQDAGLMAPESLSLPQWLMEKSVLVGFLVRRVQASRARRIDWSAFTRAEPAADTTRMRGGRVPLAQHEAYVSGYRERLDHIADLCSANHVHLLLLTQPILAPDSSDARRIMERYNTVTKELAVSHGLALFDLANTLRQDPAFYLDGIHFSNAGAAEVARLIEPCVTAEVDRLAVK